ncbi:MAG: globin [Nakamurella sp.]
MTLPAGAPTPNSKTSFFEAVGGSATFDAIAEVLCDELGASAPLAPIFDGADLAQLQTRLAAFLGQYFGGPRTYAQLRGEPRLRMRHHTYSIGVAERDAWLSAAARAIDTAPLTGAQRDTIWAYLAATAEALTGK